MDTTKPKDTPETDALVLKANSGGGLTKAESNQLVALGYLERSVRYGKEGISRTWALGRRVEAIKREQQEALSLIAVREAVTAISAKLPTLAFFVARTFGSEDAVEKYLSTYSSHYTLSVADGKTRISLKISERFSGSAGYNRSPLGTFDVTVGNWEDSRRFAARKAGIPVDVIVEEIKTKLAAEKARLAAEAKRRDKVEDAVSWTKALHKELGIRSGFATAHVEVETNGRVHVKLPETMTREQAEKLLRFCKELGL